MSENDSEHDPLCQERNPHHVLPGECVCDLIIRVREDERDCDNHNYKVKNTCQHYYLGYKKGYTIALQAVGEMVGCSLGKCNQLGEISDGTPTAAVLEKLIDFIDNLEGEL